MTLSNQTSRCICKCIRIDNYLQQTTSADDFFLGALRANISIIRITGILAYSVDTDEMLRNLAHHQDLHCLIRVKKIFRIHHTLICTMSQPK